jgi:hypothetical protein
VLYHDAWPRSILTRGAPSAAAPRRSPGGARTRRVRRRPCRLARGPSACPVSGRMREMHEELNGVEHWNSVNTFIWESSPLSPPQRAVVHTVCAVVPSLHYTLFASAVVHRADRAAVHAGRVPRHGRDARRSLEVGTVLRACAPSPALWVHRGGVALASVQAPCCPRRAITARMLSSAGWIKRGHPVQLKTNSGRNRLNAHDRPLPALHHAIGQTSFRSL